MTSEQQLRQAAQVIRERGWRIGGTDDTDGPCCMLMALSVAQSARCWTEVVVPDALLDVVGISSAYEAAGIFQGPTSRVYSFNDDYCKDADDAIAALEIAADLAAP